MSNLQRPVGPKADVAELEYISALHQTQIPLLRKDGTVSATDVAAYLRSRYGLDVDFDGARDIVLGLNGDSSGNGIGSAIDGSINGRIEFAIEERDEKIEMEKIREGKDFYHSNVDNGEDGVAEDGENEEEVYLDIAQLLTIVLMPTLARLGRDHNKASKSDTEEYADEAIRMSDSISTPKLENIMSDTLAIMFRNIEEYEGSVFPVDVAETREGAPLTESLVRRLLEAHCEFERASDSSLIFDMVKMAGGNCEGGDAEPLLNVDTFVRALTSDMDRWDVDSQDKMTSAIFDVFGYENVGEMKEQEIEKEEKGEKVANDDMLETGEAEAGISFNPHIPMPKDMLNFPTEVPDAALDMHVVNSSNKTSSVVRQPTASFIDFGVDTHRSLVFAVILFVFYIMVSAVYMGLFQMIDVREGMSCSGNPMGCSLGAKIIRWLMIAVGFTVSGYVIMLPISLANNPLVRSQIITLVAFLLAGIYTSIPLALVSWWQNSLEPPYESQAQWTAVQTEFFVGMMIAFAAGCILCLYLVVMACLNTITTRTIRKGSRERPWMLTHNVRTYATVKEAATRKVNSMLVCARALHPDPRSRAQSGKKNQAEETLHNFFRHGQVNVTCGGTLWVWKHIWSKELFYTEGIWLHSRLFVGQSAQVLAATFFAIVIFLVTPLLADRCDEARSDLEAYEDLPNWIYEFVPTGRQIKGAFYPAGSLSLLVALKIISIYVPSTVGTILSFRSGVFGSLHDPNFIKYRVAADVVFTNVGNMLYAMFGAVSLFFFVVALFIFLHIWPFTVGIMKTFWAWLIGLIICILFKVIMMQICRAKMHRAFYRVKPASANFTTLALECWHLGIAGGVLVGRVVQFLLGSIFFVGRTDVPFLSEYVALGPYKFDMVPLCYWKDILGHEAHRHPYIERLGSMYMMRLVHGTDFSSRAGACWRNLFVVALFPWMKKYRVFKRGEVSVKDLGTEEKQAKDSNSKDIDTDKVSSFLKSLTTEMHSVTSETVEDFAGKETKDRSEKVLL